MRCVFAICIATIISGLAHAAARDGTYQHCLDMSGGVDPVMKKCGAKEMDRQDKILNSVYRELLAKTDKSYVEDVKKSERAWLVFREAQCMLDYNREVPGTMAGLLYQGCMVDMTNKRIVELKQQLK